MSGLGNVWEVAKGGILDFFGDEKQEAKLGADINYGLLANNFRPDMKESAVEMKTMLDNPVETGKAVVDLVGGAWRTGLGKVMPQGVMDLLEGVDELVGYDSKPQKQIASDAWADLVATHGSVDGFKKFAQENPFEAMIELTGAGLVARQVAKVTAPVVMKAIDVAERNGLMDKIRQVGALPVGMSIKDINSMSTKELNAFIAELDKYKRDGVIPNGIGLDRLEDDALKRALETGALRPDYVKEGEPLVENLIDPYDAFADRVVATGMADTTATGQKTVEVAGHEVGFGGVRDDGGQGFANAPWNKNRAYGQEDLAWANDIIAISSLRNNLISAEQLKTANDIVKSVGFAPWQMGQGAVNFSVQMSETMVKTALTNLSKKDVADFDKMIANQKTLKHFKDKNGKKIKPSEHVYTFPDWQGIEKTDLATLGGRRKDLIQHFDTNFRTEIGSMLEHQLANTDPSQLFTDRYSLHNVMSTDIAKGVVPSGHKSYNMAVPGKFEGRLNQPINLLDMFDIEHKGVKLTPEIMTGSFGAHANKSLMGRKIHQLIKEEDVARAIKKNANREKVKKNNKK